MNTVEARLRIACQTLSLIGFAGLLVLAIITSLDVILRWTLGMPIQGVNDVSSVVMAVVISSCIPANLAMKQNISVEVFGTLASPRTKAALNVFASSITLVFIVLIAWQFIPYVSSLRANGDRTWVLGWQIWPWWTTASGMMILAAIAQIVVFLADLTALVRGDYPTAASENDPAITDAHL